ncbi:STAS domain-containing protein [Streptomyces katrae]|uniref:STAS domain-containing protein n=1 Tax=Streptomyces katrae TaxID=68223 RepID=UPI000D13E7FF|nr:STAS domain-containing protein [Streptomyces katrae]
MRSECEIHIRRYGATMVVTPVGELDADSGQALNAVQTALDQDVAAVACDMRHLSFLDVVGLHHLLGLARDTRSRGIAFFAYNWQHQPRRLVDFTDELLQGEGQDRRTAPTRLLRRTLREATESARATGAALASTADQPDATPHRDADGPAAERGVAPAVLPPTGGHRA